MKPIPLDLNSFPVDEAKELLKDLKKELADVIDQDSAANEYLQIIMYIIASAEKELKGVTNLSVLPKDRQARIFADMSTILNFIQQSQMQEEMEEEFE